MAYTVIKNFSIREEFSSLPLSEYTKFMLSAMRIQPQTLKEILLPIEKPFASDAVDLAIDAIHDAIASGSKIMVCGDYDADGICATTIMVDALGRLGATVGYYIPDRLKEGYGLKAKTVEAAIEKGYDVFILVDNGVSAKEALEVIAMAQKQAIIFDHHIISSDVLCDVLVHPADFEPYYQEMCASGLAYLFAKEANVATPAMLQLAMVATIGDMMPLLGFNRELVKKGLASYNESAYLPLSLLMDKVNGPMDEQTVAFQIVPKLNVVGRLADLANVNQVVRYLLATQVDQLEPVAKAIKELNQKRKEKTAEMLAVALEKLGDGPMDVIVDASFHQGLVGITAGQLMRITKKPTLVLAETETSYKGSGRSDSMNLHTFLHQYADYMLHFGGHAQAAGLEVAKERFAEFSTQIMQDVYEFVESEDPVLEEVFEFPLESISCAAIKEFEQLAPFGQGFSKPLILVDHVRVDRTAHLPNKKLSKWIVSSPIAFEVICFEEVEADALEASSIAIIGNFGLNTFRNQTKCVFFAQKVLKARAF